MREILFRGKIKGLIDWKYGSYAKCVDDHYILEDSDADDNWSIVDPETVGQFTGLKDKTGKLIFEGDVVKFYNSVIFDKRIQDVIGSIVYENDGFRIQIKSGFGILNGKTTGLFDSLPEHLELEIIGTIHDNPELLEVKEND